MGFTHLAFIIIIVDFVFNRVMPFTLFEDLSLRKLFCFMFLFSNMLSKNV